jgi:hypothetical protein
MTEKCLRYRTSGFQHYNLDNQKGSKREKEKEKEVRRNDAKILKKPMCEKVV